MRVPVAGEGPAEGVQIHCSGGNRRRNGWPAPLRRRFQAGRFRRGNTCSPKASMKRSGLPLIV